MSTDPYPGIPLAQEEGASSSRYPVDARGAMGVQIGDGTTQINYYYAERTWADGVVAPPLADISGVIGSPYRGLSAFEERDAAFFFGREMAAKYVLGRMSRQLDGTGLLVVSGVSGAGKSSLLRAGVLPKLRGAGLAAAPEAVSWPCLLFTPGRVPMEELAARVASLAGLDAAAVWQGMRADPARFALTARQAALARADISGGDQHRRAPGRLLLVIDQFEQLFTQCADEEQQQAFITALHAAATTGYEPEQAPAALVVLGVRADFEARCAAYPQLADAIQDRYLVTAMTERQLWMAITEPAKMAGSRVDDDLARRLLWEVHTREPAAYGAGVLPLLSHALDQAWRNHTGDRLTLADYERTGGIEGAVAESAQRAYDHLTAAQQVMARQVFTRLTATSSDGVDTADRAARAELTEGKSSAEARDVEAVLEAFAAERLLTLAAGTVEISHEILLTAWPLLHDTWLAETHADRIVRTRLRSAADEWAHHSRDRSYLYGGSLLESATAAVGRIASDPVRHPPPSKEEKDFLLASAQANRRVRRIRNSLVTGLVILLAASLVATAVALVQTRIAIRQRDLVTRQRNLAVSGELAAKGQALVGSDPVLSRLLSVAAWQLAPTAQARYSMVNAAAQPLVGELAASNNLVSSVTFSPDGNFMATTGADGFVRLWDVPDDRELGAPLMKNEPGGSAAMFSPDGHVLAIGGYYVPGRTVRLWDIPEHRWLGSITSGGGVRLVGFGAGGKTVITLDRNILRQWDVHTQHKVGTPIIVGRASSAAAFGEPSVTATAVSSDGKIVATDDFHGVIRLWDIRSGLQIGKRRAIPGLFMAFSVNHQFLAVSGGGGVWLWPLLHHGRAHIISNGSDTVSSLAFSPSGQTLAVGSYNVNGGTVPGPGAIRLWSTRTLEEVSPPLAIVGGASAVAFSADGRTVASGSVNGTVELWDGADGRQIGSSMPSVAAYANSVAFSPDGRTLAALEDGCELKIWTLPSRNLSHAARTVTCPSDLGILTRFTDLIGIDSVAFSPDGRIMATAGYVGPLKFAKASPVRLWDTATGRLIATLPVKAIYAVFSPNGRTLAVISFEGLHVQLWNVATRHKIAAFTCNPADSLAFSPDGHAVAVGGSGCNQRNRIIDSGSEDVWLWDVSTHQQIGFFGLPGFGPVSSVTFSPNGKTLATAEDNNTVRLWDIATRRQIGAPLTSPANASIAALAFSPNGQTLAGGGNGGQIWLWDVATHNQIGAPLTSPANASIAALAFSPDGRTLATAGFDGHVRLWNTAFLINPASSICTSTRRSLTRAEWRQNAQGVPYRRICRAIQTQRP
jgi:WD40 repeat protein